MVVRCARGVPQVSGLEAATKAAAARAEGGGARPSLAERLRLGSLLEDGLSYKESFIVRCYEVGINKTATVETIANLLQVRSRARAVGRLCFSSVRIRALGGPICGVLFVIGIDMCLDSIVWISGSKFRTLHACGRVEAPLQF